ncbi:ATP-binding protein [Bacillus salitolerans]|uniref:histidine kinase n=1 Tax=Bacillus salitolerans TaxID=1437434 RepID=A0ABW4LRE7_9BACI
MKKLFDIHNKVFIAFIFIAVFPIICSSAITNYFVTKETYEVFEESTTKEIIQVEQAIHLYFETIKENSSFLSNTDVVRKAKNLTTYMNTEQPYLSTNMSPSKAGGIEEEIYALYKEFGETHENIAYIYMGTTDGGYVQWPEGQTLSYYDPRLRPWYDIAINQPDEVLRTKAYYNQIDDTHIVSTVKTIKDNDNNIIGVQGIDVSLKNLTALIEGINIGRSGYLLLVQEDGTILSHPKFPQYNAKHIIELGFNNIKTTDDLFQGMTEAKKNGVTYLLNVYTSPKLGWKFVALIEQEELTERAASINQIMFYAAIVFIFLAIFIAYLFTSRFTRPAENNIKTNQERLERSERLYKGLIEELPEAIVIKNDRKIVYVNEEAVKLLDFEIKEDLIGREHDYITFETIHNKDNKNEILLTNSKLITHKNRILEVETKTMLTMFNGEECSITMIRDLTDRKSSQELLLKSEKLSIAGQLAAGIAHEIRNPLTSLKGFLQLIKSSKVENLDQYLTIMENELDRIDEISSELIVLAKPHSNTFKTVNLLVLLDEIILLLQTQAVLHNVEIHKKYSKEAFFVHCNENQMKQVFVNLVKNAIESINDSGRIDIQVHSYTKEMVEIVISDDGPGMKEEQLERMGEPFYTTKEKGTGLGLMVSYKIIEEHKGKISATSELGLGTRFTIILPEYTGVD